MMSTECPICRKEKWTDEEACPHCADRLSTLKEHQKDTEEMGAYGLTAKQRERREFVSKAVSNTLCDEQWSLEWRNIVRYALDGWNELDKQLSELERKESEEA